MSLPRKNIKTKKLRINTSKSRSELKLLKKIIYRNNWIEEHLYSDNGNIFWSGLDLKDDDLSTALTMTTNRFPGMRDLATKTQTGFFLNKFREYFPDDFDFFPRSFMIPD
jgi:tubulin polyglutamylase TTLL11